MRLIEKVDRNFRWKYVLGVGAVILLAGVSAASYSRQGAVSNRVFKGSLDQSAHEATQAKIKESIGKLPLAFEANKGQTDPSVQFIARAAGYTAFLTADGVVMRVKGATDGVLAMKLQNAKVANHGAGSEAQPGKSNYLRGSDRSKWITNVDHYGKVSYSEAYPGVDLVYSGNQRNLEYDFVVKPGADPNQVRMTYQGAKSATLTAQGDLELVTAAGSTIAHKPVVYQMIDGHRKPVQGSYVQVASNEYGFKLGTYDASKTLVIDPTITALAYLGGLGDDEAFAVASTLTAEYLAGETASANFPTTPGACVLPGTTTPPTVPVYPAAATSCVAAGGVNTTPAAKVTADQVANNGGPTGYDAFVTKIMTDSNGVAYLAYSTYIGGTGDDVARGIAVDQNGAAYVTGWTGSVNGSGSNIQFPTTTGLGGFTGGVTQVAFLAMVTPDGTNLTYSTVLGTAGVTQSYAIALDSSMNAYIGGKASSGGLSGPSTAIQNGQYGGGTSDGFVAKFNSGGALLFSALIGGSGADQVSGIALDSSSNIYAVGSTTSVNAATPFPVTSSAVATTASGTNGFAVKIAASLSGVTWSATFGDGDETANAVAVDSQGQAYVAGSSGSAAGFAGTLPTPKVVNGSAPAAGNSAGYLLALTAKGTGSNFLDYGPAVTGVVPVNANNLTATQFGAGSFNGVALDGFAQVYVVGSATNGANGTDAIVNRYSSTGNGAGTVGVPTAASALVAVGGTGTDVGNAISVNGSDMAFIAGTTNSQPISATGLFGYPTPGAPVTSPVTGMNQINIGTPAIGKTNGGGNDAMFAAIEFQDFALTSSGISFAQTVNGAVPAPQYLSAVFLNNSPTCSAGNLAAFITLPTSTSIPKLPSGAIGVPNPVTFDVTYVGSNAYQVSMDVNAPVATGTYVSNLTFTSSCSDNAVTIPLTLTISTPLAASPQNSLTGLTESVGSGIISPLTGTAGQLAIVPVAVSTASGSALYSVALANTKAVSSNPNTTVSFPSCLVQFTTSSNGTGLSSTLTNLSASTAASLFYVGIEPNTNYNCSPNPGTYTANITVTGPGGVAATPIPFSLVVTSGIQSNTGYIIYNFTNNTSAAQQQVATLSLVNSAGGPFTYTATYSGAVCPGNGCPVFEGSSSLPPANVTFISGATGQVGLNVNNALVIQVTPAGLASGNYGGVVTISPSGSSSFAPISITLQAVVGGGLIISQPATGALNVTLPVGYIGLPVPGVILPNSWIGVTDGQIPGSPAITINGPAIASPGVTVSSTLAGILSVTGATCSMNPGNTCVFAVSFNTIGLTAGTVYSGTIGISTNGSTPVTATIPVNLTVAATPSILATTVSASGTQIPLTGVTLTAVVNQSQVCTNTVIETGGGSLGNVSYVPSAAASVNFITAPNLTNQTLIAGGTSVQFCVNPVLLGNAPGTYTGKVTITAPGAANSPFTVPVTLYLNSVPGVIELSNIGVFRAGTFALDTDRTTYNYSAANTTLASFGLPGDQPVAGDWMGTGVVSVGIFRNGAWYFDLNNDGQFETNEGPFYFGLPGDTAIVGDWTGTGTTKVGVFRCPVAPATGTCTWYLSKDVQTAATLVPGANLYDSNTLVYSFGLPGDVPVANNWVGNSHNVDAIGVFRCPAVGVCSWIVDNVGDGVYRTTDSMYSFGLPGDVPVVGDWNGGGQRKRIGVFRPLSNGLANWILEVNGTNTWAPNDIQASFGLATDKPVVGNWTLL